MKTLFRYVFAALLATTVYYYSNGTESNGQVLVQTELAPGDYTITDPDHPNYGDEVDANKIGDFCKGLRQICAQSESGLPVLWSGSMVKF